MAERVHPRESDSQPPATVEAAKPSPNDQDETAPLKPNLPVSEKPVPPPTGTYVVQVPKDQIYRYPPPENARRYQSLTRRKSQRSLCCRCFCWTLGLILLLLVLLAIAAGVLYLVFRPEALKYSVDDFAIKRFNLTSSSPLSPELDVTIRANNPNDKIGIYYQGGSSVRVYYSDVNLCNGVLPVFFQTSNNVTFLQTVLKGSDVVLGDSFKSSLQNELRRKKVPLRLNLKAPVKIKIGSIRTWKITVKLICDLTVDGLTVQSKIVSKNCDYNVNLW